MPSSTAGPGKSSGGRCTIGKTIVFVSTGAEDTSPLIKQTVRLPTSILITGNHPEGHNFCFLVFFPTEYYHET